MTISATGCSSPGLPPAPPTGGGPAASPAVAASPQAPTPTAQPGAVSGANAGAEALQATTAGGGGTTDLATVLQQLTAVLQQLNAVVSQMAAQVQQVNGGGGPVQQAPGGCPMSSGGGGCGMDGGGVGQLPPDDQSSGMGDVGQGKTSALPTSGTPAQAGKPTGASLAPLPPGSTEQQVRQRILSLAERELGLGVKEDSENNDSAGNIDRYRSAVKGKGNKLDEWCGDFASYITKMAGVPIGEGGNGEISGTAMRAWAEKAGRWYPKTQVPKPGDLIMFEWPSGGHHVGIVHHVENGKVHTIEGNTKRSVGSNTFALDYGSIWGYIRTVG